MILFFVIERTFHKKELAPETAIEI